MSPVAEEAASTLVTGGPVAVKSHVLLGILSLLPVFMPYGTNAMILLTAAVTVYVGSWRSVKMEPPSDTMSKKDAMRFPLVGSAVLVSLFVVFKLLPKDIVNLVLSLYFVLLGVFAISATIAPFLAPAFPKDLQTKKLLDVKGIKIPFVSEPLDLEATAPELLGGFFALLLCSWYVKTKHWYANNVLGLSFSIQGLEYLSLGSTQNGIILLCGLFVYDIFWVFFTPVMVSVAKSFDAPIKLLFPRIVDGANQFSMLGLGDIVIPGIYLALMLRYDHSRAYASNYFQSAFWGYVAGLGTTILIMNVFKAAQPALLYIVPAVLAPTLGHAWLKGEFMDLFSFSEEKNSPEVDTIEPNGQVNKKED